MITRRRLALIGAIVVLAAIVVLTPRSEAPDATDAVRRFISNLGHEVRDSAGLPEADGTLVLLADLRTPEEAQSILDWVEGGGHLVVTDPSSLIVPLTGASTAGTVGLTGVQELAPGCVAPVVAGTERVAVRATDQVLVADDPAFVPCFATGDGAVLLTRALGDGRVTLLGGPSALTNELLLQADNARFAAALAGDGEVVFGPPTTGPPTSAGIWDVLPDGARAAIIGIVAAAVAFALVRARRLGSPVIEEPVAPIPGSELVRAAGRLYRQARATGYAGTLVRRAAVARIGRRTGASGAGDVSGALSRASGLPPERVEAILAGPEPRTDEELMELGAELEALSMRAEMGGR